MIRKRIRILLHRSFSRKTPTSSLASVWYFPVAPFEDDTCHHRAPFGCDMGLVPWVLPLDAILGLVSWVLRLDAILVAWVLPLDAILGLVSWVLRLDAIWDLSPGCSFWMSFWLLETHFLCPLAMVVGLCPLETHFLCGWPLLFDW
jgi:hypothetical protein